MKRNSKSLMVFYTIGIAALFMAGFLLLVLFGALTYRDTTMGQSAAVIYFHLRQVK